ncbi:MAG: hypothetical protein ACK4L4_14600 [Gemmobacter sp.]
MKAARGLWGLAVLMALGGCQLPADKRDAPSPLAAEAIEVTPLDPAPEAGAVTPDAAPAAPPATEPPRPQSAPPAPRSPEALACQRRGGTYLVRRGTAGLATCQMPTRDALKACRRGSECEGECLARSGTCAPVRPLFGCNEVLDSFGRRATQCLQ